MGTKNMLMGHPKDSIMMSSVDPGLNAMNALTVNIDRQISREEVFEQISQSIPCNEFGLPKFFYRCDLIPQDLYILDEDEQQELLQSSKIEISYQEGFPTFKLSGNPLWHLMDNEVEEDHVLFKGYLDQLQTRGYRQLQLLTKDPGVGCPNIDQIKELYTNYYWAVRVKAHDLFIAAAHRRMRDVRIMSCENYTMQRTAQILETLDENFNAMFDKDKMIAVQPQDAIKMYKDVLSIQQKMLGIGSSGSGNGKKDPDATPNASMEVTLRQVARESGAILEQDQANNNGETESGNIIRLLTSDPGTAGMTQELIVRLNMGQKESKSPNGEENTKGQLSPNVNFTKDAQGKQINAKVRAKELGINDPATRVPDQRAASGADVPVLEDLNAKVDPEDDPTFVPIDDLDKEMMS